MAPDAAPVTAFSAPARRDPALDGLRGFAVLLIFLFTYGVSPVAKSAGMHVLSYFTQACWVGIVLFFAISGFLITGTIWDGIGEKFLLRNFYIHRAARILPLYLLALIVSFIGALGHGFNFASARAFLIHLFFLQDIPYLGQMALRYNSAYPIYHLWSVAVEVQFYLLWPMLLLAAENRRGARTFCLRVFVVSAFFRLIFSIPDLSFGETNLYDNFLLTHAGALALGGAVALALRSRDRSTGRIASPVRFLRRYSGYAFFGGMVLFIGVRFFDKSFLISEPAQFMFGVLGISVASAALIAIVLRTGRPRSFFSNPLLVGLGRISAGFYVFHILLQPWFNAISVALLKSMSLWSREAFETTRILVSLTLTLVISIVSYYFLERPVIRLAKRFPMPAALPGGLHLMHSARRDPQRDTTPATEFVAVKIPAENRR